MAYENRVKPNLFGIKHFSIDSESFIYDDTQMMCADITGFAYGATVTKVEGIKAHTYYFFRLIDSSKDEIAFSFYAGEFSDDSAEGIANRLIAEMWHAFGNRLLTETINNISNGKTIQIGNIAFSRQGALIKHRPLFGKNRDVQIPWDQIQTEIFQGNVTIKSSSESGVSDVLDLDRTYNAHIILEILRMLAKDPSFITVLNKKSS